MGTVKTITVSPDLTHVLVTVETVREAEPLLNDKTIFWVVKPELFAGNITGLETLLSGSYIGMRPSTEKGEPGVISSASRTRRSCRPGPRAPPSGCKASGWARSAWARRSSIRDLEVGTVLGWDLGDLASSVTIHAFVRAPYDQYVHDDSSFWNASGLSVKLANGGISVQMESLRALLLGGIAFDTPSDSTQTVAAADHGFRSMPASSWRVGGLRPPTPAPLLLPGLGRRSRRRRRRDLQRAQGRRSDRRQPGLRSQQDRIVVPVHYRVEAGRINNIAAAQGLAPGTLAAEMIKRGLRATLQSPSLITGQKIVALERIADAPPAELERDGDVFVIPTSEIGGFDSITRSANELLSKINRIDFDRIGKSISGAAAGLDDTINGPQLKKTLAALETAMVDVQDIAKKLDTDASPALKRLPEIAAQLQKALTQANRLIGSFNAGYGDNSRFRRDLDRLLPQMTDTARSIRALADLLSRHPEALIKGRTNTGKE